MMVLTRRDTLRLGLAGAGVALGGTAWATPAETAAEIAKFTAGKATEPDNITIDLPEIAENGNAVPLTVSVESEMSEKSYVKAIYVAADGNPNPGVAVFEMTPRSGKAEIALRVRLQQTEKIVAVAEMNDGSLYTASREVKVTIGGCGG